MATATLGTYDWFEQRPWLLALVLVIVTFVAYQPTWHAGFIWDDDDHLTANPAMTAPHGLKMIWSSLAVSRYYPLTLTTFWAQRRLWGLSPLPYHLVNITLHAINGILVFLLLRRLHVPAAWLAAMLWVLHPVNVESVAWITELKNTQSGFFFFLSVLCFLRFDAEKKQGWYVLAITCGLAAMLSKPSTVVLPLVLLLCGWWEHGRWNRVDVARTVPFFGVAAGMSVLTILEQRGHVLRTGTAEWQLGTAERLVVAGKAVWFYAVKVLWPVRLTFVYPRWTVNTSSFLSWVPAVVLVAVGVTLWYFRGRAGWRVALFGSSFFVVALLPVLGFVDVYYFRYSFVADHFQYLASIGLIALVVAAGATLSQHAGQTGGALGACAGAIAVLMLGWCTWEQAHVYQSSETLWRDTLAKNPQCWMAHNNLGAILLPLGKLPEAKEQYEQSLQINPGNAEAHNNLGNVFLQEGEASNAIAHYEQALRIKPDYAEADNGLGSVLYQAGKNEAAILLYRKALGIEPGYAEARCNLGTALLQEGELEEAVVQFSQAIQIKPDYAVPHYSLGIALIRQGKLPEAVGHWEQALQIKPDYAEVHYSWGLVLEQAGRLPEAGEHYEQALQIRPDYADAHNGLGNVLLQAGKISEAMGHYEQALHIKPHYAEAHYNLGLALARLGKLPEAVGHWEQALRIKPDYVEAHWALGMTAEQAGNVQDAIGHYKDALRIKPDFAPAKSALVRLQGAQ